MQGCGMTLIINCNESKPTWVESTLDLFEYWHVLQFILLYNYNFYIKGILAYYTIYTTHIFRPSLHQQKAPLLLDFCTFSRFCSFLRWCQSRTAQQCSSLGRELVW